MNYKCYLFSTEQTILPSQYAIVYLKDANLSHYVSNIVTLVKITKKYFTS